MTFRVAVKLALAAVLLALLSVNAAAAVKMLPFYGRALMDVELVCRSSTEKDPHIYGSSKISAFRYAMQFDSSTVHPFYVERMQTNDYVRTYYTSPSEKYVMSDSSSCTRVIYTALEEPQEWMAWTLRSLLSDSLPSTYTSGTTRGISVRNYTSEFSVLIPAEYGGLDSRKVYKATILTTVSGWTVNLMEGIDETLLSIELTSTGSSEIINNCLFTFTFYGANMSASLPTSEPPECKPQSNLKRMSRTGVARVPAAENSQVEMLEGSDSVASSTEITTSSSSEPKTSTPFMMPEFPPYFTANFFVISPGQKSVFQLREAFNPQHQMSRAQLSYPLTGAAGRVYDYEWFVTAFNQMTLYHETFAVPDGQETVSKAVREYFWPDKDTCTRLLLGYDVLAEDPEALLLASLSTPAAFIGNETVRNIPCGVWAAEVGGSRVTWYWATPELSNVDSFNSKRTHYLGRKYGTLVRMTVTGKGGAPPLFTHHPFFPQSSSFPVADRELACKSLEPTGADMGCNGWGDQKPYNLIYDITSFVPYVRDEDYDLSDRCAVAPLSGSIPSVGCSFSSVSDSIVAVLLVVVAVLFGVMGGSCVWCRYSRMVRRQQEELVRLTQALQNPLPPAGPPGDAAAEGENLGAWSSGTPDMKARP
ncbi:hypothetical protein ABL78_8303 [Leptomonas seymouri]|uniref:Enriched in surface-labeled proteome protein 9 n=1 Tax=Leptomonas seymouri TaxID=5684 RepID=A0A0N1IH70_LEPSE|nr:hypothetical protein ABL78_8303 [Leptomonas seymouri]|eukprot:KPI82684.1 hypothetical protein ABL78_8303 [Leptomonas seymouri]